jgi:hypothetical protein
MCPCERYEGIRERRNTVPFVTNLGTNTGGSTLSPERAQYKLYTGNFVTQHIAKRKTHLANGGRKGQWLCPNARKRGKSH